jgi:hypothetical protein
MNTISKELRSQIVAELKKQKDNFSSDRAHATKLGINASQYSRIMAGNLFDILSDASWSSLARQTGVNLRGKEKWKTAITPVYTKITQQLKKCQENSISAILVDDADVGKTHAAKEYALQNKYVAYVDCSLNKSKRELVPAIARAFGVRYEGRYKDVREDLIFYINNVAEKPLVILDEAGDLDSGARLELKALWNGTERNCGWYQMGADGLREVVRRGIEGRRVGFTETFSRYGSKFQRFTPEGKEDKDKFAMSQAAMIINANAKEGVDKQKVLIKTKGSLRRIYTELSKL